MTACGCQFENWAAEQLGSFHDDITLNSGDTPQEPRVGMAERVPAKLFSIPNFLAAGPGYLLQHGLPEYGFSPPLCWWQTPNLPDDDTSSLFST
jgi:hypothetical protein